MLTFLRSPYYEYLLVYFTNKIHSLDASTDAHIQRLIRSAFPRHTLIAVSHKLDTILDFDKVVVMNEGQLVEFGRPHQLLGRRGSWFKSLYESSEHEDNVDTQDSLLPVVH